MIDQDGIPTFVEVKRSSDTRLRRETVGQLLDYAANGLAFLSAETIRERFERRCEAAGVDPDELLRGLVGGEDEPQELWRRVKTNLQAERIRLVLLADRVPVEVRRAIELLNRFEGVDLSPDSGFQGVPLAALRDEAGLAGVLARPQASNA